MGDYAQQALQLLAAVIQARGLVLTTDLLDSLQLQVVAASAEQVASMGVLFHQCGRIKDIKSITRTKAPPIEEMEAYVRKVGLDKFSYVPGYKYGDNVQIKLEIDGSQSRTELDNLTRRADVLREGMKSLKKGSEEYVAASKELRQVNARMKECGMQSGLRTSSAGS